MSLAERGTWHRECARGGMPRRAGVQRSYVDDVLSLASEGVGTGTGGILGMKIHSAM